MKMILIKKDRKQMMLMMSFKGFCNNITISKP